MHHIDARTSDVAHGNEEVVATGIIIGQGSTVALRPDALQLSETQPRHLDDRIDAPVALIAPMRRIGCLDDATLERLYKGVCGAT